MVAIEPRQEAPPTPKTFSHKSCWFDGQGHKICGDWSATSHNLTDIHREHGVSDLHNEHSANKNETIHGITFKDDPNKPTAQFEGHKEDDPSGFRDAHDDKDEWTDHKEESDHKHQDWKLNGTTPTGGAKTEDFWYDDQPHNITDVVDTKPDNTSDVTVDDSDQSAFQADFNIDNPGDKHDEDGSLAGQHRSKHQLEQHTGPGVFDSHEETNEQTVSSGSFDTFEGVSDAMHDFDEHIDLPENYGIPANFPPPPPPHDLKREAAAASEWVIGNVNAFDVVVAHPLPPAQDQQATPPVQMVHVRSAVDPNLGRGLYIAAICLLCVGVPLAILAVVYACSRKRRAEQRVLKVERAAKRLEALVAGGVELGPVKRVGKEDEDWKGWEEA